MGVRAIHTHLYPTDGRAEKWCNCRSLCNNPASERPEESKLAVHKIIFRYIAMELNAFKFSFLPLYLLPSLPPSFLLFCFWQRIQCDQWQYLTSLEGSENLQWPLKSLYIALCVEVKIIFSEERVWIFFLKSQPTCPAKAFCTTGTKLFRVQKGQHMKWMFAHSEPSLGSCLWALALSKTCSYSQGSSRPTIWGPLDQLKP